MVGLILRCLFLICRQVPPQESMGQLEFTHLDFIQVGSLALDCGLDGFISGSGLGSDGTQLQYSCLENPMNGGAW